MANTKFTKSKALEQYIQVRAELTRVQTLMVDLIEKRDSLYQFITDEKMLPPKHGRRSGQITTRAWIASRGGHATPEEVAVQFGIPRVLAYARINTMRYKGRGVYKDGTFILNAKSMKEVA